MVRLIFGKNSRTSKNTEIPKTEEHLRLNRFLLVLIKKSVLARPTKSGPDLEKKVRIQTLPRYADLNYVK